MKPLEIRVVLSVASLAVCLIASAAPPALADVIEINSAGAVTVHRASAVYTAEGVRPILGLPEWTRAEAPASVGELLKSAAQRQSVSTELLEAVAWQESRFRHSAVSPKGATGVMQIMPGTAAALGVDRFDLRQNIEGGAMYLRQMLGRYGGSVPLALAAYNAGPGAVDRYRGVPPFRETQAYVTAIVGRLATRADILPPAPLLIEP